MKKETIFKHELNESIQVNAAMNCLNNRNNHKQINEVAPVVAAAGRMLLPMLRPVITKLVQKALVKIGTHARPTEVLKLVMGMLTKGEFAKKMAEKCGQTWNEIPSDVKKEIRDAIIDAFKSQSPQEQEETSEIDYAQLADDVCASYRGPLSKLDLKDSINYIVKMVAKKIGKTVDTLSPQELTAIQKAAKHSVWYVSEQEELSVEQEEMPQMERRDIILALSEYMSESWIDTGDDGDLDDIYYAVADILDKTGDYPASTSWEDCKPWCQKHYREVEARIWNEDEESNVTSKVTVRTPMGLKQMSLSTEVIEAFVRQTGSIEFSDRSAVRVISGIVREMMKTGYTPTSDEQEIVDIQNAKIKQARASRDEITDRSMNAFTD